MEAGVCCNYDDWGVEGYRRYGTYTDDLAGARLILCPDRDALGVKYITAVDGDFSDRVEGFVLAGTQSLWRQPQGGMDIGDEICDGIVLGTGSANDRDGILAKIINRDRYQDATKLLPKLEESFTIDSLISRGVRG